MSERSCILLKFYIKPQPDTCAHISPYRLYLIEILHQTTTEEATSIFGTELYLIEILHQTTTSGLESADILHYISRLSSLKSSNSHFDEVNLMYFSMSKNKTNIHKISKKTPAAEVYPVWPVRPSPRNS